MALRRWKPFFPAFGAIDTAIEAATEGCSRDKYRQVRSDLVEMLCDCDAAGSDDDVRAEGLCRLLDRAMAEALLTLRAVPVPVTPTMLAATDVAKAVSGLLRHEAGWVRALARGILAQWSSSIEAEAEGAALDTLLQILCEHEVAAPVTGGCVSSGGPEMIVLQADSIKQAAKISDLECPKKMPPGVSIAGSDRVRNEQTGDAKRKHPGPGAGGCYREADDVKRQRKVPEMVEHRPREMEPAMKSRSRVSSWRSTDERHFSTSTRHRRV
ncbi:unnamed protein product [Miscanthus lutarioriparius]|uniref:TFIIS N-terminal domain-containing protein n=1 Tax=Miscanthus lutarioriparius TaxID=422564 RepID=A0A811MH24_9POAL|nr:unnamed protein product [Miscanthus lutarioriparius]